MFGKYMLAILRLTPISLVSDGKYRDFSCQKNHLLLKYKNPDNKTYVFKINTERHLSNSNCALNCFIVLNVQIHIYDLHII